MIARLALPTDPEDLCDDAIAQLGTFRSDDPYHDDSFGCEQRAGRDPVAKA